MSESDDVSNPADADTHPVGNLGALAGKLAFETVARLLEDLRTWIQVDAEITGQDHLGHLAARAEAMGSWEARMAEQRAADGPERTRRARRWARRTLAAANEHYAGQPRRPEAVDYAEALTAAVRQAADYRRAGTPLPSAADLIAAVADPVVVRPEPIPEPAKIGLIVLPSDDDDLAAYADDHETDNDPNDRPSRPPPATAAQRQAAADIVHDCIAATVEQIARVLTLVAYRDTDLDENRQNLEAGTAVPPDAATVGTAALLAIAVEILRLSDAEHARRIAPLMSRIASPAPDAAGGGEHEK